jgi:nicotinate-nucleotide adenylyltransferase
MTWKSPEEVIALAQFVAYSRPGFLPEQLLNALPSRYLSRVHVLESINLEISSTNIRKRLSEHKPVRYLIPDAVLEYIERNELYVR